jgi:5'-3' exonuclease
MLLDTASLYFRAFHGVPTTLTAADGTPVNAVRGFLDMLARLVEDRRPGRLVCCLDADWRPPFRVEALPGYKAHRVAGPSGAEDVPPTLLPQVPMLLAVLDAVGLPMVGAAGYEADDVIATLALREPGPTDVVTGDRDLLALVDDERQVRVIYLGRGMSRREVLDEAQVHRRYGVGPAQYTDLAILRGDPSDGLPGVPGIGEKTAAGLLERWGSLTRLLSAVQDDRTDLSRRDALAGSLNYLQAASAVIPMRTEVPLPAGLDTTLPHEVVHPARLVGLSSRWGLDGPLNRLAAALRAAQPSVS